MQRKADLFIKSNSKIYGRINLIPTYIIEAWGSIKGVQVWIQGEEWEIVSANTYVIELKYQSEKDSRIYSIRWFIDHEGLIQREKDFLKNPNKV